MRSRLERVLITSTATTHCFSSTLRTASASSSASHIMHRSAQSLHQRRTIGTYKHLMSPIAAKLTAAASQSIIPSSSSTASAPPPPLSSPIGGTITSGTRNIEITKSLQLTHGGVLPSFTINYYDSLFFDADAERKPIVYIMPSMSHSALVCRSPADVKANKGVSGWWEHVVGSGEGYGIDLQSFRVISASPLGAPYGSTSPLSIDPITRKQYRATFPVITPLDQARVHKRLMEHLKISRVHAIVGASMGGMQVLQFASHFPDAYDRVIAICTTGQSSSSTQALRSVQRAAVRMDPHFYSGDYADHRDENGHQRGPYQGLGIARMFGTICYRSREEFDARFTNKPVSISKASTVSSPSKLDTTTATAASSLHHLPSLCFEVERYLHHQAETFTGRYDANCYLTLSQCMDLMDLASITATTATAPAAVTSIASSSSSSTFTSTSSSSTSISYDQACARIPDTKQFLLLPISSDALIPPTEMEQLGSVLGSQGKRVHYERIHSLFGHDAFLKESSTFNPRFHEFLETNVENGVERVRQYVNQLFDV